MVSVQKPQGNLSSALVPWAPHEDAAWRVHYFASAESLAPAHTDANCAVPAAAAATVAAQGLDCAECPSLFKPHSCFGRFEGR